MLKSAEFAKKREKCEKCGFYAPWRPSRFLACISNENGALFGPFLLKVAFGRKSALFSEKGGKWRFSHFWAEKCAFPRKGWSFACSRWDHLGRGTELLPSAGPPLSRWPATAPATFFLLFLITTGSVPESSLGTSVPPFTPIWCVGGGSQTPWCCSYHKRRRRCSYHRRRWYFSNH